MRDGELTTSGEDLRPVSAVKINGAALFPVQKRRIYIE
jgi:hypothetical protein